MFILLGMLVPFLLCGLLVRRPTWRTALFLFVYILLFTGFAYHREINRPLPRSKTALAGVSTRA